MESAHAHCFWRAKLTAVIVGSAANNPKKRLGKFEMTPKHTLKKSAFYFGAMRQSSACRLISWMLFCCTYRCS